MRTPTKTINLVIILIFAIFVLYDIDNFHEVEIPYSDWIIVTDRRHFYVVIGINWYSLYLRSVSDFTLKNNLAFSYIKHNYLTIFELKEKKGRISRERYYGHNSLRYNFNCIFWSILCGVPKF